MVMRHDEARGETMMALAIVHEMQDNTVRTGPATTSKHAKHHAYR